MVMKKRSLTREQVRNVDRMAIHQYGMSGLVLMENAGRGVVDELVKLDVAGPVVICCGKGNNAGDGFVIARHLDNREIPVKALMWSSPDKLQGDAAENYNVLAKTAVPIEVFTTSQDASRLTAALEGAVWIIDALLGTGARGDPRPPLDKVIRQLNAHPANRLAIDVPSGLDCDTGQAAESTFQADHTCTFVAPKTGFETEGAVNFTGHVHVVDIGVPRQLIDEI